MNLKNILFCLAFFKDDKSPVAYISQYDYNTLYERIAAYINSGSSVVNLVNFPVYKIWQMVD